MLHDVALQADKYQKLGSHVINAGVNNKSCRFEMFCNCFFTVHEWNAIPADVRWRYVMFCYDPLTPDTEQLLRNLTKIRTKAVTKYYKYAFFYVHPFAMHRYNNVLVIIKSNMHTCLSNKTLL